jgi:hypothetical protein
MTGTFLSLPMGEHSGGGMYFLRVPSLAEADAIAADDPFHQVCILMKEDAWFDR